MPDFIFKLSPNIILGSYTTARLGQTAREWGTRYMCIIDPVLKEVGLADRIVESLDSRNIEYFVFDEIPETADSATIEQALALGREAHIQGVIAAGGTKVSGIARAVCAAFNAGGNFYNYLDGEELTSEPLPLVCLPSTIRDSFLFSRSTPVTDARSRQIKLLKLPSPPCRLVIFDPNSTVTLTVTQRAAMSIETLCTAAEAYLSQRANFFSDTIAEKALNLLVTGMDGSPTLTVATPQEVLLTQGGCMASIAAAAASPGAASLLALAVNARYGISRSLVSAILFPYTMEDTLKFKSDRLAKIAALMHVPSDQSPQEMAAALPDSIRNRLALANLPARLKDLSVSIEQLALAAEDAGQLEYMSGLPRSMTADDLFELVKQAF